GSQVATRAVAPRQAAPEGARRGGLYGPAGGARGRDRESRHTPIEPAYSSSTSATTRRCRQSRRASTSIRSLPPTGGDPPSPRGAGCRVIGNPGDEEGGDRGR